MSWATCRLQWEIHKAAANALRLHVAALPALAAALLLTRLALLFFSCQAQARLNHQDWHHAVQPSCGILRTLNLDAGVGSNWANCQGLPRGLLIGLTAVWAFTASWLWPQLALWAGWMSHRRPTLPSILESAFLIVVTEGLLEALELIGRLSTASWHLLKRVVARRQNATLGLIDPPAEPVPCPKLPRPDKLKRCCSSSARQESYT